MLIQGWNDTVRVFPAVPHHWQDLAFRDLLTEGAFRVSAVRRGGQTISVRIVATVDSALRLMDPFAGQPFQATGAEAERIDEFLVCDMRKGQELIVRPAGADSPS